MYTTQVIYRFALAQVECTGVFYLTIVNTILCHCHSWSVLFVWFGSLRPINNLSVIKGRVFLGWTNSKLELMFLIKDTTQRWSRVKHSTTEPLRSLPLLVGTTVKHLTKYVVFCSHCWKVPFYRCGMLSCAKRILMATGKRTVKSYATHTVTGMWANLIQNVKCRILEGTIMIALNKLNLLKSQLSVRILIRSLHR